MLSESEWFCYSPEKFAQLSVCLFLSDYFIKWEKTETWKCIDTSDKKYKPCKCNTREKDEND